MTMLLDHPFAPLLDTGRRRAATSAPAATFRPPTDLLVGESEARVVMDAPGLTTEDLEIELVDGMLTIRGERRYPYLGEEDSHGLRRLERGFGSFERVFRVPKDVDPAAIEASIDTGVLTVSVPLPDSRKPHRVEIRAGGGAPAIDAVATESSGDATLNGKRELAGASA